MHYEPHTFIIPDVAGISTATMDNHLKLYAGYVKHVNLIREKIAAYNQDFENNSYAIAEMQRRLGFEFDGMRNHEYYFEQLEGGPKTLPEDCALSALIEKQFGSLDAWKQQFRTIANTRGVGWAMLYYDASTEQLVQTWVDEQHLGQLVDTRIILAVDMWEHSYMHDYLSADKGKYLDAYFSAINWETVAARIPN